MPRHKRRAVPATAKNTQPEGTNTESIEKSESSIDEAAYKNNYVPLLKANKDEKTITGVVLVPDTPDAHNDTFPKAVIRKAAHDFMVAYNKTVKMGVQHKKFNKPFVILESYIAPINFVLGTKTIAEGSWVIVVKVLDDKIWKKVKKGEITGFSIGGTGKAKKLKK